MKALIACEFSGVVREAFNAYSGVRAFSCDLLPCEDGRIDNHILGDVRDILNDGWDIMIGFPPCPFLCLSGVRWLYGGSGHVPNRKRWKAMDTAAEFFNCLLNAPISQIALENPIQHGEARRRIRKYDQIVQPWMFGDGEVKAICLWLKNLPMLKPTKIVDGRKPRVHYASPSPDRWKERSRTLPGLAQAMAEQWILAATSVEAAPEQQSEA